MRLLPLALVLLSSVESQQPIPRACHVFGAALVAADTRSPTFIRLEPIGTCLRDGNGVLQFVYAVENISDAPVLVSIRIAHFTRGGIPMGSRMFSVYVDARATEYVMSDSGLHGPFPLRGSDRFVAAILRLHFGEFDWQADPDEVRALQRAPK